MTILNMNYSKSGGGSNIGEPVLRATWTNNSATIRWTDGDDINTIPPSTFDYAVLVRKIGSAPTSPSDGTIVETETVKDTYSVTGYTDTGLTTGTSYFYNVFCYSTTGGISYGTPVEATPGIFEWPDIDSFSQTIRVYSGIYGAHAIGAGGNGEYIYIGMDSINLTQHTITDGDLSNYSSTAASSLSGYQSRGLWCKEDGTLLFNSTDSGYIYTIDMSTPYSLNSAVVDSYNVGNACCGIGLSQDGTRLYHGSWTQGAEKLFYEYTLSTPFDISTRGTATTHTVNAISASSGDNSYIYQIAISPSGKKMYFSADNGVIHQYNLVTPYDWSTAIYYGSLNTFTGRCSFQFRIDGQRIYALNVSNKYLYQFDAS